MILHNLQAIKRFRDSDPKPKALFEWNLLYSRKRQNSLIYPKGWKLTTQAYLVRGFNLTDSAILIAEKTGRIYYKFL